MRELPFDLADPPEEPPPGVSQIMAWRLAVRLHRDHSPAVVDPARPAACRACADPWPCHGRRLAWRALLATLRAAPAPRVPAEGKFREPAEGKIREPAEWRFRVSTEWEEGENRNTGSVES